jgi:hypothetical protein
MLMMRLSTLAVQAPLLLVLAGTAAATPVTIDFTLTATEGSQFGVTAPAEITGSFVGLLLLGSSQRKLRRERDFGFLDADRHSGL